MKKCYYLLMVVLMALVSVGFTACGNDEPEIVNIVGTWVLDTDLDGDFAMMMQFKRSGEFYQVVERIQADGTPVYVVFHGKYELSKNNKLTQLALIYDYDSDDDGEKDLVICNYQVQGDKLFLQGQEPFTFVRVKDSVIEPYL